MPLLHFICTACGRQTNYVSEVNERAPASVRCRVCEEPATMDAKPAEEKGYISKGSIRVTIHSFQCSSKECQHYFDASVWNEREKSSDGKPCPKCGSHSEWRISPPRVDTSDMRYPYFDRGLGMTVKSKQHRLDICANPRKYGINSNGLTPVDGDWDVDAYIKDRVREEEKLIEGYNEYADRLEHDPKFRSFRKARDQGRI